MTFLNVRPRLVYLSLLKIQDLRVKDTHVKRLKTSSFIAQNFIEKGYKPDLLDLHISRVEK